ncbi:unnamed protein product [Commensalibacter communis]|uniref:hypothetical protein n=1 Tax=Commensalibacter communis TaxID=2972786 RepID=UPI0022FF847F|nr:hypothetical protein [Commensalibacter communis]CAI3953601.1 unnamed protein product [Commensalibacter communis]CAI3959184.1 unnamed protein product [Commensalibacter communis]
MHNNHQTAKDIVIIQGLLDEIKRLESECNLKNAKIKVLSYNNQRLNDIIITKDEIIATLSSELREYSTVLSLAHLPIAKTDVVDLSKQPFFQQNGGGNG